VSWSVIKMHERACDIVKDTDWVLALRLCVVALVTNELKGG